jgi:hypothetical protein
MYGVGKMALGAWIVLLVAMFCVVACGRAEPGECGPNAGCAEVPCDPLLDGRRLTELSRESRRALPPVVGSRQVSFRCGREAVAMQVRQGIPASIAVFAGDRAYVTAEIPVRSAHNPLQPYYFAHARKVPRRGCQTRVLSGRVSYVGTNSGRVALTPHGQFDIALDTEIRTPKVDGIPRLLTGQRVIVRALRCNGRGKTRIARSIAADR